MSRNEEVRKILESREIAKKQNEVCRRKARRGIDPDVLFVRSATWPKSKRIDK